MAAISFKVASPFSTISSPCSPVVYFAAPKGRIPIFPSTLYHFISGLKLPEGGQGDRDREIGEIGRAQILNHSFMRW